MQRHLKTIYGGLTMRAIEKNIIREIQFGNNNQIEKNFSCRDRLKKEGCNQYKIYLWDSLIFCHSVKTNKNYFCFHGYMTNTTKGRINAFITGLSGACAGIYQKNYQLFYTEKNGNDIAKIDSKKYYEIQSDGTIEAIENIFDYL